MEQYNFVLTEILDKTLADTSLQFNVALQWCINMKNSLGNVFISLVKNGKLPALLTEPPPAREVVYLKSSGNT